jgi:hypothetical protein
MAPGLRKFALTVHIISSIGWLGAVAGFLALAITGLLSEDVQMVRAAYLAMNVIAWFVIAPLALASLLSGVIQSLGTSWGLFRHYWVLIKFVITFLATLVLLIKLALISSMADAAKTALSSADLVQPRIELVVHAAGGLLVLLVPAVLSVYKPRGLTRYGQRKQQT